MVTAPPQAPAYYWKWSDGSHATVRTMRGPATAPMLIVTGLPARPGDVIALDFLASGRWYREASARTDASGAASLRLYPYCEADRWCDQRVRYRIVAGGQVQVITVDYVNASS